MFSFFSSNLRDFSDMVLVMLENLQLSPVSRLSWVSSLAYPNLLGTKGYVVVVVVVLLLFT
jgi:hypothetical protein